jgi:hypothetical protein
MNRAYFYQGMKMKLTWLFFLVLLLFILVEQLAAQENMSVEKLTADPQTFIFSDNKTTVQSYVYSTLAGRSNCCGNDAIFVETKIKAGGLLESVRFLNTKANNECYQKSIKDILQHIRWNEAKLGSNRTVFFELRPSIVCEGKRDNNYVPIPPTNWTDSNIAINTPITNETQKPKKETEVTAPAETTAVKIDAPQTDKTDNITQSADTDKKTKETKHITIEKGAIVSKDTAAKPRELPLTLPKQQYRSTGEKNPDPKHKETTLNTVIDNIPVPEYIDGDSRLGPYVKRSLRQQGVCGLVHALVELTVLPNGNVSEYRILNVNSEQTRSALANTIAGLKYKPYSINLNRNAYLEFKTDIDCSGGKAPSNVNLDTIPDYVKYPEKKQPQVPPAPASPAPPLKTNN